jgi:hypothetical protein
MQCFDMLFDMLSSALQSKNLLERVWVQSQLSDGFTPKYGLLFHASIHSLAPVLLTLLRRPCPLIFTDTSTLTYKLPFICDLTDRVSHGLIFEYKAPRKYDFLAPAPYDFLLLVPLFSFADPSDSFQCVSASLSGVEFDMDDGIEEQEDVDPVRMPLMPPM